MGSNIIISSDEIVVCPKCSNKFPIELGITRQAVEQHEEEYEKVLQERTIELKEELSKEAASSAEKKYKSQISNLTDELDEGYRLTPAQEAWASKGKQRVNRSDLEKLIIKQKGLCALSGAPMIFDRAYGNPNINRRGCHPLYAAIDHVSPGNEEYGHQIVCYDLNDLKGHLPHKVFMELQNTSAWKDLMQQWKAQAENNRMDIEAFKTLLKD